MEEEKTPLFSIPYKMDETRFVNFYKNAIPRSSKKTGIILNSILSLFIIGSILGLIFTDDYSIFIPGIILWGYLLIWYNLDLSGKKYKKLYSFYKIHHNIESTLNFYEDYFEVFNKYGRSYIPYDKLYQIKENQESFLILLGPGSGYIFYKSEITPEIDQFLKNLKEKIN